MSLHSLSVQYFRADVPVNRSETFKTKKENLINNVCKDETSFFVQVSKVGFVASKKIFLLKFPTLILIDFSFIGGVFTFGWKFRSVGVDLKLLPKPVKVSNDGTPRTIHQGSAAASAAAVRQSGRLLTLGSSV